MVRRFDFYEQQTMKKVEVEDINLFTGIFEEKKQGYVKACIIPFFSIWLFVKELFFRAFIGAILAGIFMIILFVIGVEIKLGSILGASVGCVIGALIPMLIKRIYRKFR